MEYVPDVYCAKCGKAVPWGQMFRVHEAQSNRRYIVVSCHGERQHLDFVNQPDETISLWGNPNDDHRLLQAPEATKDTPE